MKANELRLGNYLIETSPRGFPKKENIFQVKPEHFCDEFLYRQMNSHSMVQPIPLTEQWLKDFGFIKGSKKNRSENVFYIDIEMNGKRYYFVRYGNMFDWEFGDMTLAQLKYVHQLQNLYFALTGKELTK